MMSRVAAALTVGLVVVVAGCASAQTRNRRPFRDLTRAVGQADAAQTLELRIQWTAAAGQSGQPSNSLTVLQQKVIPGGPRRERNPQISQNHLVVVVDDGAGRELDWRLIPDPRFVRAETPDANGRLTGRVLEQTAVEFLVAIPDLRDARRIQIYQPMWNGKDYSLEPLAQVSIGAAR